MKEGKILIADDNRGILDALQILLQKDFEAVKGITGTGQLITELGRGNYDLVLLDMNFKAGINTGNEGIHWLREIKSRYADVEVVMITAYGDVELAVRALKEGAADFVLKPWENEKLIATLKAAYKLRKSNVEIRGLKSREELLKSEANRTKPFVSGTSAAMREIQQTMAKVADTDANVLITGENGTGKEMIARELHRLSSRASELFVLVDLSAVAETLFESELFGHRKGAFTDAIEDKTGRILMAHHGTLFLDEIGNIPMHLQSKLLNVLQTRTIMPVGATMEIGVDIRLISATNAGLTELIRLGRFRQDLLYRMNTIHIHLPPLRERTEDIGPLALFFLDRHTRKYGKTGMTLRDDALKKLRTHPWPGNIRELEHAVEKAVILSEKPAIGADDLMLGTAVTEETVPDTLEEMEIGMIRTALRKHSQNLSAAAAQLGITRQTLYNKLKKYGI
jgi:DNA-binding NtrC family response regulator